MAQQLPPAVKRFQAIKALNKQVATHMKKHNLQARVRSVVYQSFFDKLDDRTKQLINGVKR